MTQKHSLWLVPPEEQLTKLSKFIRRFSERTLAPYFIPHITLLGDIPCPTDDIIDKILPDIEKWSELPLILDQTMFGNLFYMSFYATVHENQMLAQMHQTCAFLFPDAAIPPRYTPHLSLAYGDIDQAIKDLFQEQFSPELPMRFSIKSVQIVKSSNDTPIEDWTCIHEIPLKKGLAT